MRMNAPFMLNRRTDDAFSTLKDLLTSELLLQYRYFTKPFVLTTDASNESLGAILSQGSIGRPPDCLCQTNICKFRKELLYEREGVSSYCMGL